MSNDDMIRPGMTVRTASILREWLGIGRGGPNVTQRKAGAVGVVHHPFPGEPAWYVQHDGDALLTVYRATELTPVPPAASSAETALSTTPNLSAIETHFAEVEAKRAALVEALERLASEIPDVPPWSMLKAQATTEARGASKIGEVPRWRAMIAELQRPKGPAIRVVEGSGEWMRVVYSGEFSHRTKTQIVLRGGGRFSLEGYERAGYNTGRRIHPEDLPTAQTTDWKPAKGAK